MLGSSTGLIKTEDHEEGEISGISAANIPAWFKAFYKPGLEIETFSKSGLFLFNFQFTIQFH